MHIGEDDFGAVFENRAQSFSCIPGFGYDLYIRLVFE
jgi:hypothetical protein